MEFLFLLLVVFFVIMAIITVIGHVIWLTVAAFLRFLFSDNTTPKNGHKPVRLFEPTVKPLDDLDITERQIVSFYVDGKIDERTYNLLIRRIRAERVNFTPAAKVPASAPVSPAPSIEIPVETPVPANVPSVVTAALVASDDEIIIKPVPTFIIDDEPTPKYERPTPPPRPPRRPFSEVLNSFMEESNIRWGEIIGGLLIIGCSTALVVSLWAQISQIPVLKFLIFTTVTAILFGIGLYTEHRWKLPTTSRGILTIATLLVPLNFLAIAAVSASNTSGALVIGSELLAPAIFLCLVYFAGRVITPGCAHILSAGVLGSSVGQLLVRHFAAVDTSPALLVLLGAFPVACYVVTVGIALRIVLDDREIDESETTTVFTILGTMSFAALLPFGLLLYKSGPLGMSMMYLAPLVTLWGLPMLATGTILWRRVNNKELVASRTTGTALGILGVMIVLAGMMLAWPNPASIVPAALLNFAIFTALAVALELPVANLVAAMCFALAYLVTCHVVVGNITWQNLRVMSLLDVSLQVASGQLLVGAFALFLVVSEWLSQRRRERDSYYYLISACVIGVVSLLIAAFSRDFGDYEGLWIIYGLYSLGAFWIAWRHKLLPCAWIGSALLLLSLANSFAYELSFSFPWQTALFAHATICAIAAIVSSRYERGKVLAQPLNYSALISIVLGVVCLFQANTWEVTWMQAQRVFWIAGILLLLLWLNRRRLILNAFQIAVICALVLSVKAALQQFEWYSYLPHAFLHPAALQIQGTVLALFCLAWLGLRFLVKRAQDGWKLDAWRLLDSHFSVDRVVMWYLLGGFLLLTVYGALSGVTQELGARGIGFAGFNLAGFAHQEALALGSWILLGLLLVAMLVSAFERRSSVYLLGALTVLAAIIPLLAGQFEHQIATATAWRWFAAIFLLCGSLAIWSRRIICRGGPLWPPQSQTANAGAATEGRPYNDGTEAFGNDGTEAFANDGTEAFGNDGTEAFANDGIAAFANDVEVFAKQARMLLIVLTFVPLAVLTIIPALRAMYYLPVQSPISGFFSLFVDGFSYGIPLVITGLVMIGYALRERLPRFAFYAGALFNATVTLAFLLAVVTARGSMDRVVLVRLVQLNALTFAVYMLPWLSTRGRWESGLSQSDQRLADYLLQLQLALAVVLNVALFFPVVATLIVAPERTGAGTIATGSFLGWLTFFATVIAAAWLAAKRTIRPPSWAVAALLLGVSCLLASTASEVSGWIGLHTLTVSITLSAWLMLMAADLTFNFGETWQSRCRHFAAIAGGIAVVLSLRSLADAQTSYWWSIGPLLAITALAATLNLKTLERRYIYAAGILFNLAVSLWWVFVLGRVLTESRFLLTNLIAGSLAGLLWLWLELRSQRLRGRKTLLALSFHNLAAIVALGSLMLIVIVGSFVDGWLSPLLHAPFLSWLAFLSVLAFMTACLWDRNAKFAVGGLYALGLTACAIALRQLELNTTQYTWSATIVLAAYSVIAALLWHRRKQLIDFAKQFGMPERISPDKTELNWLMAFSIVAVVIVGLLAYWINVSFLDLGLRVSAGLALAAQFLTFGLLAEGAHETRWRRAAIGAFVAGAVLTGWSWLTPGSDATWLNRSVILMLETFGLTALYGFALNRVNVRWPQWTNAARACVPWLLGAGVLALFFCLATEIRYQVEFGAVRIHPLSLVAIGLTLVAAVVISVLFALSPSHDPLNLSERGRMRYVYVAEVMLALLFLHIRLTMPWLFSGFIERYWPLVVMLIAYFGIVTSEALRRQKVLVLAQPIERTGAFLPLLPVLGFWLASSEVDFSIVLFLVGGLYGLLSILRRSFAFGLLAAVAGNAGLWYVWQRTSDYGFLQHPQLWLIPVALSVLLAAYLNEDKLSEDQMTGVRYLSLAAIYVSSTADIFVNGVANSPWLPLILGSFSLAGVFAGILFRIRGLLLLGAIFLLLSITTMIWYASINFGWTWLWYVAGIVTGATIIFMFALFEKKRTEVLRVVEGLKEWDR